MCRGEVAQTALNAETALIKALRLRRCAVIEQAMVDGFVQAKNGLVGGT